MPRIDGSRLQEVAARYDVKVHINRGRTSLKLIGRLGHAKQFQGYLDSFRQVSQIVLVSSFTHGLQHIVTEEIRLPSGLHVDNVDNNTVEEVSRVTGAVVEREGGKV